MSRPLAKEFQKNHPIISIILHVPFIVIFLVLFVFLIKFEIEGTMKVHVFPELLVLSVLIFLFAGLLNSVKNLKR